MKESQILCVAFLYINMLHFLQQRVKMQFPSWSIDVVAGSGGTIRLSTLILDLARLPQATVTRMPRLESWEITEK